MGPATDLAWRRRGAFYALLLIPAIPLALAFLVHRLWIRRKGLIGLRAKCTGTGPAAPPDGILIHGVSLGEVQLMRPLVPEIERRLRRRCVLSTSSETGTAALREHFPDHSRQLLPLDLPWAVGTFLRRLRPAAVILLELEIWPLLLLGCHLRGIPVVLVNARLGADSFRGYRTAGPLLRPLLRRVRLALAQNALWASRLRGLGVPRVAVPGSLKADMVRRADATERDAEAARLGLEPGAAHDKAVFLAASTSSPEEELLIASWRKWGRAAGWRLVLCPRHPERGEAVAGICHRNSIPCVRTSTDPLPAPPDHAVIVDEIGRLGALYANATLAVVGGSLGSGRGGQNMLEAAAAGCCTVVGPDTRNFPDAMALLDEAGGVVTTDPSTLDHDLDHLAADRALRVGVGTAGQRAWRSGQGALACTLEYLERSIPPGGSAP